MGTRIGRHFAWGTKREWPAYTLSDAQIKQLLTGRRNLGIWVGDRLVAVDYRGKLLLCQKNHAKKKMRKVV